MKANEYSRSSLAEDDPRLRRHLRAATILSFSTTYSISLALLRRYIKMTAPPCIDVNQMTFWQVIRRGQSLGLISEKHVWAEHRRIISVAREAYDQQKAQEVFEWIPDFLEDARHLQGELQSRTTRPGRERRPGPGPACFRRNETSGLITEEQ